MLKLVYSHRPAHLLDALSEQVISIRDRSPLLPISVLSAGASVERSIELGLAQRMGIAANLRHSRPRRYLAELLQRRSEVELLNRRALERRLLALLGDARFLDAPGLQPLRRYLHAELSDRTPGRRTVQLSRKLSRLYDQLALHAPARLLEMEENVPSISFEGEGSASTPIWQASLWRELRRVVPELPLYACYRQLREVAPKTPLFVYGLSELPIAVLQSLRVLSEGTDVTVLHPNPCREFWEDALGREDELDDATPLPLAWWGRLGRETIRRLNEAAGGSFEARFEDPDIPRVEESAEAFAGDLSGEESGQTSLFPMLGVPSGSHRPTRGLLHRIRDDILLYRRGDRGANAASAELVDPSLRIAAAPNLKRELEYVAESIWEVVREEGIRFSDIALRVPPGALSSVLPVLERVFSEAENIPYHVASTALHLRSAPFELVEAIVALLETDLRRADMLRVLMHPRLRVEGLRMEGGAERAHWPALVDLAGAFQGLDRAAFAGTYVEGDSLNWRQAALRWSLGELMGDAAPLSLDGYAYRPVSGGHDASPHLLAERVQSILKAATRAREPGTLEEWSTFFAELIETFVEPRGDRERQQLQRVVRVARNLLRGSQGIVVSSGPAAPETEDVLGAQVFSFEAAAELFLGGVRSLAASEGEVLCEGVHVAELEDSQFVAFDAIFVVGLSEGALPRRAGGDDLSGMGERDEVAELIASRPAQRDRYAFLELFQLARRRLYFSWVAFDASSGEKVEPASLLHQLLSLLEHQYLGASARVERIDWLRAREQIASPRGNARAALGEATIEASILLGGERARRALGREIVRSDLHGLPPHWEDALFLGAQENSLSFEDAAPESPVFLSSLKTFLRNPAQGFASDRLAMRDDDEREAFAREEEPLRASGLDRVAALRGALLDGLATRQRPEKLFRERIEVLKDAGRWPLGALNEREMERCDQILESWKKGLIGSVSRSGLKPVTIRYGAGFEFASALSSEHVVAPVQLARHTLLGRAAVALEDGRCSLALVTGHPSSKAELAELRLRHEVEAFVDYLVAVASEGIQRDAHHSLIVIGGESGRALRRVFSEVSPEAARSTLSGWTDEMRQEAHDYYLPFGIVAGLSMQWKERHPSKVDELMERLARKDQNAEREGRLFERPLRGTHRLRRLTGREVLERIERRFGLFFRVRGQE